MKKRGETVMNFVLVTGLIVIGVIVISNLRAISFAQTKDIELDIATSYIEKITKEIEESYIFPNDIIKIVTYEGVDNYRLTIHNNIINMYFPRTEFNLTRTFLVSNFNVIPNKFETSGNVTIIFKKRNLYVTNNIECNLNDGICDPGCILEDICDTDCYNESIQDACISICTDINNDGLTDDLDEDNVCDQDCYNQFRNGGIYDVDCLESNDGLCDPDTHNNPDEYCDSDCGGQNGICDPDCGFYDQDCHHLDNGLCEVDRNENCINQPIDCNCTPLNKLCNLTVGDLQGCI